MQFLIRRRNAGIASLALVATLAVTFVGLGPSVGAVAHRGYDAAANAFCQPVQTYAQPAANFDPTTASVAQLRANGFPPRPPAGNDAATQLWETMVTGAVTYVAPDPTCGTNTHAAVYTGNWAGHVVPNSNYSGEHFTWSEGTWTQPSVPGNSTYSDSDWQSAPDASFWTGVGVSSIEQAGADSIATTDPTYKFWTEDYPNNTVWEGPSISPGDAADVYVEYISSSDCYYFLEDNSTGKYSSFDNSCPYDGYGAANWINERMNGLYLPNFGEHATGGNYFGDNSNTYGLSPTNNDRYIMTSTCLSTGTVLSEPTAVQTDTTYNNEWYAGSPYSNAC